MNLARYVASTGRKRFQPLTMDQWAAMFTYNGSVYGLGTQTLGGKAEEITGDFQGLAAGAYRSNGVIFACMLARMLLFSEARFQYQRMRGGRPGDLYGTQDLTLLEKPWVNGTTGNLLTRMIQDADLDGNSFWTPELDPAAPARRRLQRLRPDWVTIVLGSRSIPDEAGVAHDAELVGYVYSPGGRNSKHDPVVFRPEMVAHFNPVPDPAFRFRGISWLTPVIREIMGDNAATDHKLKFFENGATPNMVVSLTPESAPNPEAFERWMEKFEQQNEGLDKAYKTLYLGGGSTATVVGADMKQIDFKVTQGAGETRIAAAAGVPPVIVGLSEGLEASTYSNYSQARRRFADGTMRPLWREAAGSLAKLVKVPGDSRLWYDARDIAFLREDEKDAAEIQQVNAAAIKSLIDAGFTPDSVVSAVENSDWGRLEHTGLYSVQLQPPGTVMSPTSNGQPALPATTGQP